MPEIPPAPTSRVKGPTRSKACESCKSRKIRCSGFPPPCENCATRKDKCVFGHRKIPLRKNVNKSLLVAESTAILSNSINVVHPTLIHQDTKTTQLYESASTGAFAHGTTLNGEFLIDRILFASQAGGLLSHEPRFSLKVNGLFSAFITQNTSGFLPDLLTDGAYRLTFFSDSRLEFLSRKLGNQKVSDLVRRISTIVKNRIRSPDASNAMSLLSGTRTFKPFEDQHTASGYITTYFDRVHSLFPHLSRESFESITSTTIIADTLTTDKAFSALYHSVLALGCLYDGGGSFEPGKGQAWQLFSISLSLIPALEDSSDPLLSLQAITTAAIYAMSISCLAIEQGIMKQAARMAQDMSNSKCSSDEAFRRTFWVLYSIEKMSSFHFGRSSAFIDSDIVTAIPAAMGPNLSPFHWTLTFARHARLLSRAMNSLYSPGICQEGPAYYVPIIDHLFDDLEQWRVSIPQEMRPGPIFQSHLFRRRSTGPSAIWINYLYYSFRLILLRSYLQVVSDPSREGHKSQAITARENLVAVSRSILEIVTFVDVEPSTPIWILAGIPICALFVLFDQVINDPKLVDTRSNLALLEIAGGHFSRIEFASGGSLPGSLIAEFAYIAREYVNETMCSSATIDNDVAGGKMDSEWNDVLVSSNETSQMIQPLTEDLSQDITSSAFDFFIQDPWISGNNLLLGTDVMDIFNNLG